MSLFFWSLPSTSGVMVHPACGGSHGESGVADGDSGQLVKQRVTLQATSRQAGRSGKRHHSYQLGLGKVLLDELDGGLQTVESLA